MFPGEDIKVFDLDGKEYQVRGDRSYVRTANPREDLRMVTVADYTFVTNRKVVVQSNDQSVNLPGFKDQGDALINVRGGQYGRRLSIEFNGAERAAVQLPDGSQPAHVNEVDGQAIAEKLAAEREGVLAWIV
ncbi:hypothetical protein, partial [Xylella fastidiosa]|uniref:phage nozzle protein n=1 Tax=Xylella fastidiosa TaxID=2371 RepID=UPI0019310D1A